MQKNTTNLLIRRKRKVSILNRRAQVNTLVKQMKKTVKSVDPNSIIWYQSGRKY